MLVPYRPMSPTVRNWLIIGAVVVLLLAIGRWREKRANAPKKGSRELEGLTIHPVERIEEALEVVRSLA